MPSGIDVLLNREEQLGLKKKPPGTPTILVVDDQDTIRSQIVSELEDQDYIVLEASTIDAARDLVKKNKVDVALLDIIMGPDDKVGAGLAFKKEIDKISPNTLSYFVTGKAGTSFQDLQGNFQGTTLMRDYNPFGVINKTDGVKAIAVAVRAGLEHIILTRELEKSNRMLSESNNDLSESNQQLSKSVVAMLGTYLQGILRDDPEVRSCLKDYKESSKVTRFKDGPKELGDRVNIALDGGTGFIGQAYMRRVLENSDPNIHLYVIVRDGRKPFDERMDIPEQYRDRVHFVRGDITEKHLGMSDSDWSRLTSSGEEGIHYYVHCAASTNYEDQVEGQNFRLNVQGAIRAVEFARNCENLQRFVHISTAYVEGKPEISSSDEEPKPAEELAPLENGEWLKYSFRNMYEETKYGAELVVASNRDLPFVIVRPTIVVGDSNDGFCNETTIYHFARSFQAAKRGLKKEPQEHDLRITIDPKVPKNFICVDDVVEIMEMARVSDYAHQKVIHAATPENITTGDITTAITSVMGLPVDMVGDGPIAERVDGRYLDPILDRGYGSVDSKGLVRFKEDEIVKIYEDTEIVEPLVGVSRSLGGEDLMNPDFRLKPNIPYTKSDPAPTGTERFLNAAHGVYKGYTGSIEGRDPKWNVDNVYEIAGEVNTDFEFHPMTQDRLTFLFERFLNNRRDTMTLKWNVQKE
ncbi:SDR family oxidoreductase [Nanoarchaeota archaeon]